MSSIEKKHIAEIERAENLSNSLPVKRSNDPVVVEAARAQIEQSDQYKLRDLAAQEQMALWAMWMFVAAIATLLITAIGTWAILRQVRFTRQAVEEAVAGTEAMREANVISREIGEAQARCYLSARDAKFRIDQHGTPILTMIVLNSGQSPARNFRWSFRVRMAKLLNGWVWENQHFDPGGDRDISAQQEEPLELGLADMHPLP